LDENILNLKSHAEDYLIAVSIILTTASIFYEGIEFFAVPVDWCVICLFFYTRIPLRLDSYFRTTAFKNDLSIRLGLVFFPAVMLFLLILSVPFGFFLLPEELANFGTLNLSISILGVIAVVFVSIFYFSWRVWKCSDPALAERLWRKACESTEDYERDRILYKTSRIDRFLTKAMAPGVAPTVVSVVLLFSWLILAISDVLLAMLLIFWLAYNVLYEVSQRQTSLKNRSKSAYKFVKNLDRILAWEGLLKTALSGRMEGIMEVIILTGCFCLLILLSIGSLASFIGMFGFLCQWYVLVALVQIARRIGFRKITSRTSQPPTLPKFSNVVLPFCLIMLAGFSIAGYMDLLQSPEALRIFAIMSLCLNITAIISIVLWIKKKEDEKSVRARKERRNVSLKYDAYRLYAAFYTLGLPIALLGKSLDGLGFWTALSGALIFLSINDIVRDKFGQSSPKTYATLTTLHMAIGTYVILGFAIWFIPELSFLLVTAAVILGALLIIMWVQTVRTRSLN